MARSSQKRPGNQPGTSQEKLSLHARVPTTLHASACSQLFLFGSCPRLSVDIGRVEMFKIALQYPNSTLYWLVQAGSQRLRIHIYSRRASLALQMHATIPLIIALLDRFACSVGTF